MSRYFTQFDGPRLRATGTLMQRLPNPVFMERQDDNFVVATAEGDMTGAPGDYVAHDPLSGHVWPVKASYVELHYRPAPPGRPELVGA
jgi:hypothetical protein